MDDSEYESEDGNRATSLNDPRLPGVDYNDSGVDSDFDAEEGFMAGGTYPGERRPRHKRHDNNRSPNRRVYIPNEDSLQESAKGNIAYLQRFVEMMKQPLIIAIVFLLFESNPLRNFAIRTLPIGVGFDGQLDFIGMVILALTAGTMVVFAEKFIDKQLK